MAWFATVLENLLFPCYILPLQVYIM